MNRSSIKRHSISCLMACFGVVALILSFSFEARAQNQSNPLQFGEQENPNEPGLSRAERIRRQEAYIRRKLQESRAKEEAEKKAALEQKEKEEEAAGSRPNVPPTPPEDAPNIIGAASTQEKLDLVKEHTDNPSVWIARIGSSPDNLLAEDEDGFRKMAFFIDPATIVTRVGDTFLTQCRLITLDKTKCDRLELVIHYPPKYLEAVSIHHERLAPNVIGEPEWGIDPELGEIHYKAEFIEPLDSLNSPLISVLWRGMKPGENLELKLQHEDRHSKAFYRGRLMSQNEFGPAGVLIGSSVRILAAEEGVPEGVRMVKQKVKDFSPALAPLGELNDRPPVMWLNYKRLDHYEQGQWVVIDVTLDNPFEVPFDELHFALRYDPEIIEFADTDEGNWIREGSNILDGPFRSNWNWNLHLINHIDQANGIIQYRMGQSALRRQTDGVVARLVGRILKPAEEPLLDWMVDTGAQKNEPTTGIYLLGENLLERYARLVAVGATDSPASDETSPFYDRADPSVYRE